jgi:hypothetical protein
MMNKNKIRPTSKAGRKLTLRLWALSACTFIFMKLLSIHSYLGYMLNKLQTFNKNLSSRPQVSVLGLM